MSQIIEPLASTRPQYCAISSSLYNLRVQFKTGSHAARWREGSGLKYLNILQ